jgi:branched-chain amino acid transport system substrate-binding protein
VFAKKKEEYGMKHLVSLAALTAALACGSAQAQQVKVKIGVMSDMSSLYADIGGPGSTAAAKLAIADFTKDNPNVQVELVSADHQNKADVGSGVVNKWFDTEGVDAVIDVPNSGVALATSEITRTKNKVFVVSGAASSDLSGAKCNANTVHWTYDTWMLANGTGKALVKTGGDTWFFLTADYAFGHALERDTSAAVEANGGKVVGKVRHPLNTNDFSSFLLQAQTSKAKIIGMANAGGDTINTIKAGAEFGIAAGGQKFAGLLVFASDVNALGLQTAQGLTLTETWYWDQNDANRAWTKRWQVERPGKFPTMVQAGVYAGTLHYLKAVAALKSSADGKAVVAKMKELPTEDVLFGKGTVRPDGRKTHDAYLFEVKKPAESKYPGDFYHVRATIPAAEAFRPLKDGGCTLVSG